MFLSAVLNEVGTFIRPVSATQSSDIKFQSIIWKHPTKAFNLSFEYLILEIDIQKK